MLKGLTQIVKDLLDPNFKVKKIYTKDDRRDYLNSFPPEMKPNIGVKSARPWQFTKTGTTTTHAGKTASSKPNPKDRKHLIPKTCVLKINNPKLNSIYHELQKIDLHKFTNAGAVLFRVFIELSLDSYIETHNLTTVSKDSTLLMKVTEVSSHMEKQRYADKHICKGIRSAASNKNDLLGIACGVRWL